MECFGTDIDIYAARRSNVSAFDIFFWALLRVAHDVLRLVRVELLFNLCEHGSLLRSIKSQFYVQQKSENKWKWFQLNLAGISFLLFSLQIFGDKTEPICMNKLKCRTVCSVHCTVAVHQRHEMHASTHFTSVCSAVLCSPVCALLFSIEIFIQLVRREIDTFMSSLRTFSYSRILSRSMWRAHKSNYWFCAFSVVALSAAFAHIMSVSFISMECCLPHARFHFISGPAHSNCRITMRPTTGSTVDIWWHSSFGRCRKNKREFREWQTIVDWRNYCQTKLQ